MRPLSEMQPDTFAGVRIVLTDMDETLTFQGRLPARTYAALERLRDAGLIVIPVTAAPAGWCDQMARMWPISGVIGENGALFFRRAGQSHTLLRQFWSNEDERARISEKLDRLRQQIPIDVPDAVVADDQPFRLSDLAFARPADEARRKALVSAIWKQGAVATVNNLWVIASFAPYDKLKMSGRVLYRDFGVNIHTERNFIAYVGDSTNDAPMFAFFRHSIGVSTVTAYLHEIPVPPTWITPEPGGEGFVQIADAILSCRIPKQRAS